MVAAVATAGSPPVKEESMYAVIRQGRAKAGMAEELVRGIKEGAIPIISDVEGFMAYYVVYAPDDTVTAISIFKPCGSGGVEQTRARVDRTEPRASAHRASHGGRRAGDRAYVGMEISASELRSCSIASFMRIRLTW